VEKLSSAERILLVDDEAAEAELLAEYISKMGFEVEIASNGDEMYQRIESFDPHCLLLDLELPGKHGLGLLSELRQANYKFGIIITTGTGVDVDMIVGLESGADDYVEKPINPRELLARMRSVLRRVTSLQEAVDEANVAAFEGYTLDMTSHTLRDETNHEINITAHEYQLLEVLVKNPNRVLTRDQIMNSISEQGHISSDRSIDVLVSKVRKKLCPDASRKSPIKTVRGYGYIMTAKVELRAMVAA